METAASSSETSANLRDKYVRRLRARLARPEITVADARDGMLDCYVSTYHTGVEHGLQRILGVDASPDQVAQVATKMFRDRLGKRGVSFDEPTLEALNDIKDELDGEFHFAELPAEVSATHDQVCSLLLAKADGLIEHKGDRPVVAPDKATAELPPPPPMRAADPEPAASVPPRRPRSATTAFTPTVPPAALRKAPVVPVPSLSKPVSTPVTDSLRDALRTYLEDLAHSARTAAPSELLRGLDRARGLALSIEEFATDATLPG